MSAPDSSLYEYAVVRYVPRVDREEFINIGLIMMCKRRKWMRGEIKLNPQRLLAFDPNVNLEALTRQSALFMRDDVPGPSLPVEEKYRWLTAVKSAVLQVSPSHPGILCATASEGLPKREDGEALLDSEFERLMNELIL